MLPLALGPDYECNNSKQDERQKPKTLRFHLLNKPVDPNFKDDLIWLLERAGDRGPWSCLPCIPELARFRTRHAEPGRRF